MTELLPVLTAAFRHRSARQRTLFRHVRRDLGTVCSQRERRVAAPQFPKAIAYNAGRVLSYAFLGVVVAVLGQDGR